MPTDVKHLRPGVYVTREALHTRAPASGAILLVRRGASGSQTLFEMHPNQPSPSGSEQVDVDLTALAKVCFDGGASTVYAACCADDSQLHAVLLEAVQKRDMRVIVTDSDGFTDRLTGFCGDMTEQGCECVCVVACAGYSDAVQLAARLNNERAVAVCQSSSSRGIEGSIVTAAAFAAVIAVRGATGAPVSGAVLGGVSGLEAFTDSQLDACIECGITAMQTTPAGIQTVRAVTTRLYTDSQADLVWRDLSVVLSADAVIGSVRRMLAAKLVSARNNAETRRSVSTQTVILLEQLMREGLIEDYEVPTVLPDKHDPSVCVLPLTFTPACCLNSIHVCATVRL